MLRFVTGNLNYSSWSMRAYLALEQAGAEYKTLDVGMFVKDDWRDKILQFSGAGKVPLLVHGSLTIHESVAICEYLNEQFPAAKLWPADVALRARGRAISCEMLSSFSALRSEMPCNLRRRAKVTPKSPALEKDIARVFDIWEASMATSSGHFLLGDFSIADCMYYPVATRFRTYGVTLPPSAQRYSEALFAHPAIKKLEALATHTDAIPRYDL